MTAKPMQTDRRRSRGVILFVVLLIVLMTGLLAAGLNFYMRSQAAGAGADQQLSQAEESARAGVAYAAAILLDPRQRSVNLTDNPELFQDHPVLGGPSGDAKAVQWQFSLMRDNPADDKQPAYGISDECGKLNLNVVTEDQLMALPGMTPEIAQAILDWRDADSTPREFGAEVDYYSRLPQPYSPRNGPFESVEELLLVRGVTPQLLYGNDMNRNGLLEPNENDGDASPPSDNGDGQLNPGWIAYLTVYAAEPNITYDRRPRLNINSGAAQTIHDEMVKRGFSEELATFVQQARQANVRFASPADLLGAKITAGGGRGGRGGGGGGNAQELVSPLSPEELPKVLEELTCRRAQLRAGVINPAVAPEPVLLAIGFTSDEARAAINAREGLDPEEALTCAWLIKQSVLTEERFKALAPRLCGRGWQFRIESIGYSRQLGLFHRMETIIDISQGQPDVLYSRNLTGLGPAYVLSEKQQ